MKAALPMRFLSVTALSRRAALRGLRGRRQVDGQARGWRRRNRRLDAHHPDPVRRCPLRGEGEHQVAGPDSACRGLDAVRGAQDDGDRRPRPAGRVRARGEEARDRGSTGSRRQAAHGPQEEVLRRQRGEVPGRPQAAGLHRRRGPHEPDGEHPRAEDLQSHHEEREGDAGRDLRLLHGEPLPVRDRTDPGRAGDPRRQEEQALAEQIYTQLKGGASFATLAKKYSQDPQLKDKGGTFTATKGSDVPSSTPRSSRPRRRPARS